MCVCVWKLGSCPYISLSLWSCNPLVQLLSLSSPFFPALDIYNISCSCLARHDTCIIMTHTLTTNLLSPHILARQSSGQTCWLQFSKLTLSSVCVCVSKQFLCRISFWGGFGWNKWMKECMHACMNLCRYEKRVYIIRAWSTCRCFLWPGQQTWGERRESQGMEPTETYER